jgi:hypothetical protein
MVYPMPKLALRKAYITITVESAKGKDVTEDEGNGALTFFVPDTYLHAQADVSFGIDPHQLLTEAQFDSPLGEGLTLAEMCEQLLKNIDKER